MRRFGAAWCTTVVGLVLAGTAEAQWNPGRPDSHAPIGVMGDHRHHAGEVMLSYRFMSMDMEGSRVATDRVSDAEILSPDGYGFSVTPTRMPMRMHMLGAMWAPADAVTLLAMVPFHSREMQHITRAGGSFTTESGGVGDVTVGGLIGLTEWGNQSLHANAGLSLPTGSIDERDVLPISNGMAVQLPYPMQVGSGTWDLMPGLTWLGQAGEFSWGAQASAVLPLGENDRGWALGDRYQGTAWSARRLGSSVSVSLRLAARTWGNVTGADGAASVNPALVPTARTDLRGGRRVDVGVGLNFYLPKTSALRFALEGLLPLYRDLDGPQLELDWTVVAGIQLVPIR